MSKENSTATVNPPAPLNQTKVRTVTAADRLVPYQLWLLSILSLFYLWAAPDTWRFSPDSGIYIGTAENLVTTGAYVFNGFPNLLYYPGLPLLLSLPITIFGLDFQILHLFGTGLTLLSIWLARFYFSPRRYGLIGILLPFLLLSHALIQQQFSVVLSDAVFLVCVLAAALAWRHFTETRSWWLLALCIGIVSYAPLVRFNGLLLIAAFGSALLANAFQSPERRVTAVLKAGVIGAISLIPFAVWTWRNYVLHTSDTYNMANSFFFGLKGLSQYYTSPVSADWIDAAWKFPLYKIAFSLDELIEGFVGQEVAIHFSLEVTLATVLLLGLLGLWPWIKSANNLERAYVVLSVLFALYWMSKGRDLYYQNRQLWLPVLPFLTVIFALGVRSLSQLVSRTRLKTAMSVLVGCLVFLTLQHGTNRALANTTPWRTAQDQAINRTLQGLAQFSEQKIPPQTTIMSVDWGVLPRTMKRASFRVQNDPSHRASLERMLKYDTRYLVIMDGIDKLVPYAKKMVEDLPSLFTEVYRTGQEDNAVFAAVYAIDLDAVRIHLANTTALEAATTL